MPLSDLWKKKSPEELVRQNQRALNRVVRELESERKKLEQQEKKIITDIRKMAKTGQMAAVRIMAKDLVRTRNYIKKFYLMKANIQAISLKLQTIRSQAAMAKAMKGVTKAIAGMNSRMNLPQLQKIMADFERESEIMDLKEEQISDTIEDVIGEEGEEEESEALVQQVFEELGLQYTEELAGVVPGSSLPEKKAEGGATAQLEERLANLKSQ